MKISRISGMSNARQWTDCHVLLVAESGFSMLDIYACGRFGLDRNVVSSFAEKVNTSNEAGSLYPRAPVSAIPQKVFRDLAGSKSAEVMADFRRHIADFIRANEERIKATKLLVDFHVSPNPVLESYLEVAEEMFFLRSAGSVLKEVVIAA